MIAIDGPAWGSDKTPHGNDHERAGGCHQVVEHDAPARLGPGEAVHAGLQVVEQAVGPAHRAGFDGVKKAEQSKGHDLPDQPVGMVSHSTSQNATTSSQTMEPGSSTPMLRAATVQAHQPKGMDTAIKRPQEKSLIHGDISTKDSHAHSVPAVPGAMRDSPEPKPSASMWAGWAKRKPGVGRAMGARLSVSCGNTVKGSVMAPIIPAPLRAGDRLLTPRCQEGARTMQVLVQHTLEICMKNAISWFEIPTTQPGRGPGLLRGGTAAPHAPRSHGPERRRGVCLRHAADGTGGALMMGPTAPQVASGGTLVYLDASPSLDAALARAQAAGGGVAVPRTALPEGMGFFAHIRDLDGNRVGLHALQ